MYKLITKDKKIIELHYLKDGKYVDKKSLIHFIRNLQDDKYDITEDIKQEAIKNLRAIAKEHNL